MWPVKQMIFAPEPHSQYGIYMLQCSAYGFSLKFIVLMPLKGHEPARGWSTVYNRVWHSPLSIILCTLDTFAYFVGGSCMYIDDIEGL